MHKGKLYLWLKMSYILRDHDDSSRIKIVIK